MVSHSPATSEARIGCEAGMNNGDPLGVFNGFDPSNKTLNPSFGDLIDSKVTNFQNFFIIKLELLELLGFLVGLDRDAPVINVCQGHV